MVDLRGVSHQVDGTVILNDITTRFQPNRFNVILGPNGAGKSTLLRVATGLLQPTLGEVRYGDRLVSSFSATALARKRAVLSQHVDLAFALSVEDVTLMGRYPHYDRVPSARDRDIVRRALDLVGMHDKRQQQYPTLSGGEQQKVQLARVLAQIWNDGSGARHTYLFLDEPTTSLDVHYQIHLLDVARGLLKHDCTIVAILHDLNIAFQYGDVFFVMDAGRLVHVATDAADLSRDLIERVFQVQAHRIHDPDTGDAVWRFALESSGRSGGTGS